MPMTFNNFLAIARNRIFPNTVPFHLALIEEIMRENVLQILSFI